MRAALLCLGGLLGGASAELQWYIDSMETLTWDRSVTLCAAKGGTVCTYNELCPGGDPATPQCSPPATCPAGTLNAAIGGSVGTTCDNWVPFLDASSAASSTRCKFVQTSPGRQCQVEGGPFTHYCAPSNAGTDPVCKQSFGDICNGRYCCSGTGLSPTGAAPAGTVACGSEGGNPCFPSAATVTMADGARKRVDALKPGEEIVAATSDGALTTDTVSLFSTAKPGASATFLNLTLAGGKALVLTPGHHLPVGGACCGALQKAEDVAVGETVWAVEGQSMAGARVLAVTKVDGANAGLHSPVLTGGSFPVVNGVVTSFDSIGRVTIARHGLGYLEAACKATGTCGLLRRAFLQSP